METKDAKEQTTATDTSQTKPKTRCNNNTTKQDDKQQPTQDYELIRSIEKDVVISFDD